MILIIDNFNLKILCRYIDLKNGVSVNEPNFIYSSFRIRITCITLKKKIVAIVAIDSQRIFELNMVKQAEERVAKREVISLPEKINAPATV